MGHPYLPTTFARRPHAFWNLSERFPPSFQLAFHLLWFSVGPPPKNELLFLKRTFYYKGVARAKEYDRDEVLKKAAGVFWRKGFEATSMGDLIEATGLNSASMYKEFGSKEGLFESTLDSYRKNWLSDFTRPLIEEPDMRGLNRFIHSIEKNAARPDYLGCLMMNTITEKNVVGEGAVRRVESFIAHLEGLLTQAIRGAQDNGGIPSGKSAAALARYIVCFVQGMVLFGRVEANKKHVREVVRTLKVSLRG